MLPMSGFGAPKAGAPGAVGAPAGCLGPPAPVAPVAVPAAPGVLAVPAVPAAPAAEDGWAADCLEPVAVVAEPAFAGALPALPWPAVVDGCCPAAASANRQRIATAGRDGRQRRREPPLRSTRAARAPVVARAMRGGVLAGFIVLIPGRSIRGRSLVPRRGPRGGEARRARRRLRPPRLRGRRRRRVEIGLLVDESLGDERRGDGVRVRLGRIQRGDRQILDVDDPREAADPVEQQRQVVVRAVEIDADRPFAIKLLVDEHAWPEILQVEAALLRRGTDAPQQVGSVAARRQDAQQLVELELELVHLLAELGQLLLCDQPFLLLVLEILEASLLRLDVVLDLIQVLPVGEPEQRRADEQADPQAVVPGLARHSQSAGRERPGVHLPLFSARGGCR